MLSFPKEETDHHEGGRSGEPSMSLPRSSAAPTTPCSALGEQREQGGLQPWWTEGMACIRPVREIYGPSKRPSRFRWRSAKRLKTQDEARIRINEAIELEVWDCLDHTWAMPHRSNEWLSNEWMNGEPLCT